MSQKYRATKKTNSLKLADISSNNLWCELSESSQAAVSGGAVLAKWGNWMYTEEFGWICQPGKVC